MTGNPTAIPIRTPRVSSGRAPSGLSVADAVSRSGRALWGRSTAFLNMRKNNTEQNTSGVPIVAAKDPLTDIIKIADIACQAKRLAGPKQDQPEDGQSLPGQLKEWRLAASHPDRDGRRDAPPR